MTDPSNHCIRVARSTVLLARDSQPDLEEGAQDEHNRDLKATCSAFFMTTGISQVFINFTILLIMVECLNSLRVQRQTQLQPVPKAR